MKLAIGLAFLIASMGAASAQYLGQSNGQTLGGSGAFYGSGSNSNSHYVSPYTRSDGTSVGGHYQTNPNNTQMDNYGTRGNYNPHNGLYGTKSPHY